MSKEKTFSRTYRFSGQTIRKLLEIQQQRDFPSITLTLETIIAEAHESLQAQEKPSASDQDKTAKEFESPKDNKAPFNYLEFAERHLCEHRDIDYENPNQWKCAGKKVARSICVNRQKRFIHYEKRCFPQHLAHHCRDCGREIRPKYAYCYQCNEERQERKADNHLSNATTIYKGY